MDFQILDTSLFDDEHHQHQALERTNRHAMVSMHFVLQWEDKQCKHTDQFFAPKLNLWRDLFPVELASDLTDKPTGYSASQTLAPGELSEEYETSRLVTLKSKQFNRQYRKNNYVEPRCGRFYPKGFLSGAQGIYPGDVRPMRVVEVKDEKLKIDLNHPLSDKALRLTASIQDIWSAGEEHGGHCHHIGEMITENGSGMQSRWRNQPTEFWSEMPFSRLASEADAAFYALPRMTSQVDAICLKQITNLYAEWLPSGGNILDLMAGWQSHLPEDHAFDESQGLGMNAEELAANPLFKAVQVFDLNQQQTLPYDDQRFDAVICSLSVEYLTQPFEVFADVARLLKPGGQFILTFSNRWSAAKVIRIWEGAHEFERPAIVLEYFLKSGSFNQLETWSSHGLPLPAADENAAAKIASDPVFAVRGFKC